MQRSELAGAVLQLKALGMDNLMGFDWLAPPPAEAMVRALEALHALGALDADARCAEGFPSRQLRHGLCPSWAHFQHGHPVRGVLFMSCGVYGSLPFPLLAFVRSVSSTVTMLRSTRQGPWNPHRNRPNIIFDCTDIQELFAYC